jgi:hypothetical protein
LASFQSIFYTWGICNSYVRPSGLYDSQDSVFAVIGRRVWPG